jgi:hypothetical protein
MNNDISLFDLEEINDSFSSRINANQEGRIDVVKLDFIETETLTWPELFKGFDELYAITYSSSTGFICKLLKMFNYSEIIFGNEDVMSYTLHDIMAYQLITIEKLRNDMSKLKLDLYKQIDEENLRLFVARKKLSHEKIYLLKASDGRKRTIFGSANLSHSAFSGSQRENIGYIDGDRAFDWYFESFESFKEDCSDSILSSSLRNADDNENADEIPVYKTATIKKILVIEPSNVLSNEVRFISDIKLLSDKFKPHIPKQDKKGKIFLSPESVKISRRKIVDSNIQEKELRGEHPQLVIDVDFKTATLNGQILDLHPTKDAISNDVELFMNFMSGYDRFHGDVKSMQARYYEFANWFFTTPFMAIMRNKAVKNNHNLLPYPVFGLLYGQSKAGKTSFLETLLKMMIGQKPKIQAPDFTRSSIEGLKRRIQGAPIIVDDLTQTRFNQHAIETIKNDDFGVSENLLYYSAVVISANEDVKAVAPEVIRRTVICRVQAGLTNTEVMKSSIVRRVQKNIGTAFYREYVRRMLEIIPLLLEELKDDDLTAAPDILKVSSEVICDILREFYSGEVPDYIRHLTLDDYFSERVTGAYARKTIQNSWKVNRKSFVVNTKANELRYNAGQTWEVDRILKELPEDLRAVKSRELILMDLEKACDFFEVNFKKKKFGIFNF